MARPELLDEAAITHALTRVPEWSREDSSIRRAVTLPAFMSGIDLVDRVARVAEAADHHPDIDIRWTTVTFTLSTHSEGGLTALDFQVAGSIDALVNEILS